MANSRVGRGWWQRKAKGQKRNDKGGWSVPPPAGYIRQNRDVFGAGTNIPHEFQCSVRGNYDKGEADWVPAY